VRRPLRTLLVLAALAVVLVVAGVAFYLVVLRDDPPDRVALTPNEGEPAEVPEGETPEGQWVVRTGDDTFVGYRVRETFAGLSVAQDAVGRTNDVQGDLTVEGESTVTAATVTAGLQALASDEDRRDDAIRGRGLETDTFPESTFVLRGPLELPSPPSAGSDVSVTASGDLTLHGVTRPVDVPLEARWSGTTIEVVGTIAVAFADYDIEPPSVGGFVSVEDEGEIELQLTFVPA
jgi:polyisoprenoid-binding protein YceI